MTELNLTEADNTITITNPGTYEISYHVVATLTNAGNLEVGVQNEGETVTGSNVTIALTAGGIGTFTNTIITDLEAGDTITLALLSSTSDSGGTVNAASLTARQLN